MGADLSTLFCDFLEFISCAFFVQLDNLFEPIRKYMETITCVFQHHLTYVHIR